MVVSSSANLYKATVTPLWLVWSSSFTVPVREPVRESVGDLEHETANKTNKIMVREPSKKTAGRLHEFTRIIFWEKDREFTRIKERIFLNDFICIN